MGERHPPSTEVAEYFTGKLVELRAGSQPEVVGGLIKSYQFNYVEGEDMAQGCMWLEFGTGRLPREIPVTVVILGGSEEDGKTAARIVKETEKLSDFRYLVLHAHFTTYSESIRQHILVYERFDCRFDFEQKNCFFMGTDTMQLAPTWAFKIKALVELLDRARSAKVTHGGLADRNSYVLCKGTIKLIDVARNSAEYSEPQDVLNLKDFLCNDSFFNGGKLSAEWDSFDMLLGSNFVTRFDDGWKAAVQGHPILQESPDETIKTFEDVHKLRGQLTEVDATKLANLLWKMWCDHAFPDYEKKLRENLSPKLDEAEAELRLAKIETLRSYFGGSSDEAKLRLARNETLRSFFVEPPDKVIDGLFSFSTLKTPIAYSDELFPLELINLARNLIRHGTKYLESLRNKAIMLKEIRYHLGSFLSLAYTLMHTLDEHENPNNPFKSAGAPSDYTLWDVIETALPSGSRR